LPGGGQYQWVMHARKQSFFEKKDQKTFANAVAVCPDISGRSSIEYA
jgi:hypothetical protein